MVAEKKEKSIKRAVVGLDESEESDGEKPLGQQFNPRQSDDQEHHVAHRPAKRSRTASHDGGTKAAHAHQHAAATQVQETAPAAEKMDMDEPPAEQHHSQDRLDAGTEADEAERADRRTSREGLGSTPFAAGALENIFPSAAGGARTSSHGAEDAAVGEAVAAAGEDAAGGGLKPRHSSRPHKDSQRLEASTSGRSMSKQASLMQQHSGGPPKRPKKGAAATQTRAVWQGEDDNWGQGAKKLPAGLQAADPPPVREAAVGWGFWQKYEGTDHGPWYRGKICWYDSKKDVYWITMEDGEFIGDQKVEEALTDVKKGDVFFCRPPPEMQPPQQPSAGAEATAASAGGSAAEQQQPSTRDVAPEKSTTPAPKRKKQPEHKPAKQQQQQQVQVKAADGEPEDAPAASAGPAAGPASDSAAKVAAKTEPAAAAAAAAEAQTAERPAKPVKQQPHSGQQKQQQLGQKQQRRPASAAASGGDGKAAAGKRPAASPPDAAATSTAAAAAAASAAAAAGGAMQRPRSAGPRQQPKLDLNGLGDQAAKLGECMLALYDGARMVQDGMIMQQKAISDLEASGFDFSQSLEEAAQQVKDHLDSQQAKKGAGAYNLVKHLASTGIHLQSEKVQANIKEKASPLWAAISGAAAPAGGAEEKPGTLVQQQRRHSTTDLQAKQQQQQQSVPQGTPRREQQQQRKPHGTPGKPVAAAGDVKQEGYDAAAAAGSGAGVQDDAAATGGLGKRCRGGSLKREAAEAAVAGGSPEPDAAADADQHQQDDAAAAEAEAPVTVLPDQRLVQRFLNLVPLQPLDDPLREKVVALLSAVLQPPTAVSPFAVANEMEQRLHAQHGIIGTGKHMYLRHFYMIWCALGGPQLLAAGEAGERARAAEAAAAAAARAAHAGSQDAGTAAEAATAAEEARSEAEAAVAAARAELDGVPGIADAAALRAALLNGEGTVDEVLSVTTRALGFDHQRDK